MGCAAGLMPKEEPMPDLSDVESVADETPGEAGDVDAAMLTKLTERALKDTLKLLNESTLERAGKPELWEEEKFKTYKGRRHSKAGGPRARRLPGAEQVEEVLLASRQPPRRRFAASCYPRHPVRFAPLNHTRVVFHRGKCSRRIQSRSHFPS